MSRALRAAVRLVTVDDDVLDALVDVAQKDAAADDVTPRITAGSEWSKARVDWLRRYHRDRRGGLSGSPAEATWALEVDGEVVGGARLARTREAGVLEAGMWVARSKRGRGTGQRAMNAVLEEAAHHSARYVIADSTSDNAPALAALKACGFSIEHDGEGNADRNRRARLISGELQRTRGKPYRAL